MAAGATTISGAYALSNTTKMEEFIESIITATTSGAQVFIIPDAGNQQCWVGVAEGVA